MRGQIISSRSWPCINLTRSCIVKERFVALTDQIILTLARHHISSSLQRPCGSCRTNWLPFLCVSSKYKPSDQSIDPDALQKVISYWCCLPNTASGRVGLPLDVSALFSDRYCSNQYTNPVFILGPGEGLFALSSVVVVKLVTIRVGIRQQSRRARPRYKTNHMVAYESSTLYNRTHRICGTSHADSIERETANLEMW